MKDLVKTNREVYITNKNIKNPLRSHFVQYVVTSYFEHKERNLVHCLITLSGSIHENRKLQMASNCLNVKYNGLQRHQLVFHLSAFAWWASSRTSLPHAAAKSSQLSKASLVNYRFHNCFRFQIPPVEGLINIVIKIVTSTAWVEYFPAAACSMSPKINLIQIAAKLTLLAANDIRINSLTIRPIYKRQTNCSKIQIQI